ncbi:MAG: HEPN domain-containing protein [Candidatus Riflebacteria bacterium]|nr:HEPN domain-containing protein [Candidatus Riflebacteria bacterium]
MQQARECLEDAHKLASVRGSGRSIVNRCYYAMFYAVLALLQTAGQAPRKHQGAISLFDRGFVHTGLLSKDLSRDLHRLFDARQDDDYQRLDPVTEPEVQDALRAAERFLTSACEYLQQTGKRPFPDTAAPK